MTSASPNPARTALCLCGGGITGGMYEIGALAALDDFFAPSPREFTVNDFDVYVGTSAGSFLAATLAAGIPIRRLFRAILDDDPSMFPARRSDIYRFDVRQGLGILRDLGGILLSALARGARNRIGAQELLADLTDALPAGLFSLRHYEKYLDDFLRHHALPTRFSEISRELYITANDLDSGHRAIFGQGELADAPLAKAICASSAIPLFFEPVRYKDRDFVDGAVGKIDHADIALARGAELIVVLNPLVPFRNDPDREDLPTPLVGAKHIRDKGMLSVYAQTSKMSTRTKLHQGLKRYAASHPSATLLLIEPDEHEGDMFLHNPMSFSSRRRMLRYGYESTARRLKQQREIYEAAFGRHRVSVDAARLQAPWELTG
ncbi:MAG TPA: patatin-like phospholipase family protein [Polyangia bacterium]|nr:patatin-like phospholipase family protein [Polyangia bacterium]